MALRAFFRSLSILVSQQETIGADPRRAIERTRVLLVTALTGDAIAQNLIIQAQQDLARPGNSLSLNFRDFNASDSPAS